MAVRDVRIIKALLGSVLLLAEARSAEQPSIREREVARAREMMASSILNERAWGVYFSGRLHSEELNKLLIEEFRSAARFREAAIDSDGYAFVSVLLGSAIEQRLSVSSDLLQPFLANWPAPFLMLLSWSDKSEDSLLSLRARPTSDGFWLAVNNMLFQQKSSRWYAAILNEIHFSHKVVVYDFDEATSYSTTEYASSCYDGFRKMPAGFPPVALFSLEENGSPGALLLAEGPTSIYLARSVAASGRQLMRGSCSSFRSRSDVLDGYLALLASETSKEAEQWLHRETQILYTNQASFEREIARLRAEQERAIRHLIQAAALRGFPIPNIHVRIVPKVADRRTNPVPSLPTVSSWVFKLR